MKNFPLNNIFCVFIFIDFFLLLKYLLSPLPTQVLTFISDSGLFLSERILKSLSPDFDKIHGGWSRVLTTDKVTEEKSDKTSRPPRNSSRPPSNISARKISTTVPKKSTVTTNYVLAAAEVHVDYSKIKQIAKQEPR